MNNRKYSSFFPIGLPVRRAETDDDATTLLPSPRLLPDKIPSGINFSPSDPLSPPFPAASAGENRRRARCNDPGALCHGRASPRSHRRAGTGGQSRPEPLRLQVCRARSCATVAGGCWPTRQGRPACAAPCAEPSPPCHPQRQQWKWLSLYVVVAELC